MAGPGLIVYPCPDGVHRSLFADRRDCPGMAESKLGVELGAGKSGAQFLGYVNRVTAAMTLEDLASAPAKTETLDTRKLLTYALGAFALLTLLILLARRRKRA